jgi:hypothetical protein
VTVWVAGSYGKPRPVRRAARHQGFIPVDLEHPDQPAELVEDLAVLRGDAVGVTTEPFDIAAALPVGTDPLPFREAGATWWLVEFPAETVSIDQVRGVIRGGPAAST